jgi:hypothetical protein
MRKHACAYVVSSLLRASFPVRDIRSSSHETAVSKALCTIAVKHWETAGVRFGVFRYSNTQLKALLEAETLDSPLRIPPLLIKRMISKKATASK